MSFDLFSQAPGRYTVVADYEKGGAQELCVKSGDMVQLIREGEDSQWYIALSFSIKRLLNHIYIYT